MNAACSDDYFVVRLTTFFKPCGIHFIIGNQSTLLLDFLRVDAHHLGEEDAVGLDQASRPEQADKCSQGHEPAVPAKE